MTDPEAAMPGFEWKPAEQIVVGDYLPFELDGSEWLLEVTYVDVKAKRVWITVTEPSKDQQVSIRPRRHEVIAFKEAATVIEEAEERLAATAGPSPGAKKPPS